MRAVLALSLLVAGLAFGALGAGPALAAGECQGLRVCLPVAGPWVVVPAGGVDYELACPLAGYVVAGTDARVVARDVDVSFRGELGSPVGPGITTHPSAVFHAVRARVALGATSFRPFIGCIPTNGGGGRALTAFVAQTAVIKPTQPVRSVVVNKRVQGRSQVVRVSCPVGSTIVGSTHAVAFRQRQPPSRSALGAVTVKSAVVAGAVVARITASPAAGSRAEVQLRVLCGSTR